MTKVVACIDGSRATAAVCDSGAWAAGLLGAGLSFVVPADATRMIMGNAGLADRLPHFGAAKTPAELAEAASRQARLLAAYAAALLEAARARVGPQVALVRPGDPAVQTFTRMAEQAQRARLVVLPRQMLLGEECRQGASRALSLPGCSLLAVDPDTCPPFERLVVAFDGEPCSRRMILRLLELPFLRTRSASLVMAGPSTDASRLALAWATDRLRQATRLETAQLIDGPADEVVPAFTARRGGQVLVLGNPEWNSAEPSACRALHELIRLTRAAILLVC